MFLIFHDFQFSLHTPGLQFAFLIFHVFQCFSPYSMSYSVCFSFSMIFSFPAILHVLQCAFLFSTFLLFLAIFQIKQCLFLIFHVFQFSCHIPVPTVCLSHFPRFYCFSLYSRSKNVCVFFFLTFFSFFAIFQFLKCAFLIFHVFECFSPYSRSYSVWVSLSKIGRAHV